MYLPRIICSLISAAMYRKNQMKPEGSVVTNSVVERNILGSDLQLIIIRKFLLAAVDDFCAAMCQLITTLIL